MTKTLGTVKTFLTLALVLLPGAGNASGEYVPRNGDIVFQISRSSQSHAIQAATKSRYSHVGIVFIDQGVPYVYEAIGPVTSTPLDQWIERGVQNHFVAKRLKDADVVLTKETLGRIRAVGAAYEGKPYDLTFEWSDDRIYCSELVWKVYKGALDIEVGVLQKMKDFDLSDPKVRFKVHERFGDAIPLDETVVSPASIFHSPRLIEVYNDEKYRGGSMTSR